MTAYSKSILSQFPPEIQNDLKEIALRDATDIFLTIDWNAVFDDALRRILAAKPQPKVAKKEKKK